MQSPIPKNKTGMGPLPRKDTERREGYGKETDISGNGGRNGKSVWRAKAD